METGEQHKLRILLRIAALMVGDEDVGWLTDWAAVMAPWLGSWVARWLGGSVAQWLSGSVAGWLGGWVAWWLGGLVGRLLARPVATRRC